jgi:endonuclease G
MYWNSGYDRGHQVPSADMRWSLPAMTATYYYSNICPQVAEMNRGAWADLEDWGRRYVRYSGERAFVVTGPVLETGLSKLPSADGAHHVSIPKLFWKVIADLDGPDVKGIAFVMSNAAHDEPPISFAVPIDSVEKLTGLDFFAPLDDATEARIESGFDLKAWYAKGDPHYGEVPPLKPPLPNGMFNTVQAKYHVGSTATICGTVVGTRRTQKANAVYLNFDSNNPDQDFYATVWDSNGPNFSYDPETALLNKTVCITGKVTLYDDIPRISVNNENAIMLWEEVPH